MYPFSVIITIIIVIKKSRPKYYTRVEPCCLSKHQCSFALINRLLVVFLLYWPYFLTFQDWHCSDHVSFAAEHPGKNASEVILLQYDESGNQLNTFQCNSKIPHYLRLLHCSKSGIKRPLLDSLRCVFLWQ